MALPSFQKIQTPLASESFLKASHFKLGYDHRPEGSTVISPYRIDYPPRWGSYQREPIMPPKCADVLNQEMGDAWDTCSETYLSYPAWPLGVKSAIIPDITNFKMHADPRHSILTSITRESYSYPPSLPHATPNRVDKWDDSFPSGDKEKEPLPETLYQESYPAYKEVVPAVKAPSQHLGGRFTLKGDGQNYFKSCYQANFTGEWAPPIKCCNENVVSIVFGDPRHAKAVSEQRHAYIAHKPEGQRYDSHIASAMMHRSNIQPGDGQQRFSTIMSESYPWKQSGPPFYSTSRKNESFVVIGEHSEDKKCTGMTNSQASYKEPTAKDFVTQPRIPPARELCLGDKKLTSFQSVQHSDYQPPPEIHKLDSKHKTSAGSHAFFDYEGSGVSNVNTTATQDMLVPHQGRKYELTEEELQRIKYSHLVHPWQEKRWFSTENRDAYTNKYSGPITLATADFQGSSIPLGTMTKYLPRKKPGS
ncbi:stabilizer of axonemal microtubules 5 [Erythrolamprus reginae]|uniref:stabilizer of axonemal microtubules 5 n=1 Tax=Erythrolamprus reginae TaxID=121349 RepID=UPI00396CBA2D